MSYVRGLDFVKRRQSVKRLTAEEAIAELNQMAAKADQRIAYWKGQSDHYEQIARQLSTENTELRAEIERLQTENRRLKLDFERARESRKRKRGELRREDFEG